MSDTTLLQLKVVSGSGLVERDIIVRANNPPKQLHRVIQFCLFPSLSDETISVKVSESCGKLLAHNTACVLPNRSGAYRPRK